MANMGIRHLRLAAPNLQNSWDEGERLAVHATDIMNAREEFASLEEAVADCVAVVGTTAREGLYRQHAKAPRDAAPEILAKASRGPVAIVFGREDKGLLNEEIAQCTHLLRIPVDEGYTSLNLAQAVLITAYELFSATGSYLPPHEKSAAAPQAQKAQLIYGLAYDAPSVVVITECQWSSAPTWVGVARISTFWNTTGSLVVSST